MLPMNLSQLDLNLLYTLHEVARSGSVTATAKRLGRSQPAISSRLRQLERQLDVKLLERAGRNVRLTPVGRLVCSEVTLVVETLEGLLDRVDAAAGKAVGILRIGALPTLCAYFLSPVVVQFVKKYPDVRVELVPSLTAPQVELLRKGELDAIVSVGRIDEPKLKVDVVGHVDACVATRATGRDRRRGAMSVKALAREPYISYGKIGDPFFDEVWRFLDRHKLARSARIQVSNIQAIKELVLAGAGVSILPRYTVLEAGLHARDIAGLRIALPLCVATRPSSKGAPALGHFLSAVTAHAK